MDEWISLRKDILDNIKTRSRTVVIHKSRSKTLCERIQTIIDTIIATKSGLGLDGIRVKSYVSILSATLEEIIVYLDLLQKRDATLGKRVSQYGDDEECFGKWNETLQTCCFELDLAVPSGLFDSAVDERDFDTDMGYLHRNLKDILGKVVNLVVPTEKAVEANEKLLDQQLSERLQQKTQKEAKSEKLFNKNAIRWEKLIGRGGNYDFMVGFGEVWKARYKGEYLAIKKIPSSALSDEAVASLKFEAEFMKKLSHPRIVSCLGVLEYDDNFCMIMELCVNGSLASFLSANQSSAVTWEKRVDLFIDIATGMNYLHKIGVIHRDLKLGNIVLDQYDRAKITDFGLSVVKTASMTSVKLDECGTPQYMAPECFGLVPIFSTKSDVYAFSIILWELRYYSHL